MENIGQINSVYSLLATIVVVILAPLVTEIIKNRRRKKAEPTKYDEVFLKVKKEVDKLSTKLDEHIRFDKGFQAGREVIDLIQLSPEKESLIDFKYKEYHDAGFNGGVTEVYGKYKRGEFSRREKCFYLQEKQKKGQSKSNDIKTK